jgi:hypothetical protein
MGPRVLINIGATAKQIEHLEIVIAAERIDDKFSGHLESYEFGKQVEVARYRFSRTGEVTATCLRGCAFGCEKGDSG